jgi:hypothetical protein
MIEKTEQSPDKEYKVIITRDEFKKLYRNGEANISHYPVEQKTTNKEILEKSNYQEGKELEYIIIKYKSKEERKIKYEEIKEIICLTQSSKQNFQIRFLKESKIKITLLYQYQKIMKQINEEKEKKEMENGIRALFYISGTRKNKTQANDSINFFKEKNIYYFIKKREEIEDIENIDDLYKLYKLCESKIDSKKTLEKLKDINDINIEYEILKEKICENEEERNVLKIFLKILKNGKMDKEEIKNIKKLIKKEDNHPLIKVILGSYFKFKRINHYLYKIQLKIIKKGKKCRG